MNNDLKLASIGIIRQAIVASVSQHAVYNAVASRYQLDRRVLVMYNFCNVVCKMVIQLIIDRSLSAE